MKSIDNIITIRKRSITDAHGAFSALMNKTELMMNDAAKKDPDTYKKLTASTLEDVSLEAIRKACDNTPFDGNEVKLISGHKFPDIVAEGYYGVEVKSTKKDHWTSTGSSIVESTRIESVEDIYMLFGKLGGSVPEFKCRPYGDVLYDIAVTHSPRYLIDMELGKGDTIFSKMSTTYDEFRKMEDPISAVRRYYKNNPKGKAGQSMPWWMTTGDVDKPHSFSVQMWNSLDVNERDVLLAKSMILFPSAIDPSADNTKYYPISLWLCSCYQIVVPNIRDLFSAGGKITHENGKSLKDPVPKVFGIVMKHLDTISKVLTNIDDEMALMIIEHNPALAKCAPNFYQGWISQFKDIARRNRVDLDMIDRWINEKPTLKSVGKSKE